MYFQLLWVVGARDPTENFNIQRLLQLKPRDVLTSQKEQDYTHNLVQSVTFFWMILPRPLRRICAQRPDMYFRFPRHLNFKTSWSGKLDSLYSPSVDKSCTTQTEVVTDHIYRYYLQNRINLNFSISLIHKRRARTQSAVGLALLKQSQKLMCPHGTNL